MNSLIIALTIVATMNFNPLPTTTDHHNIELHQGIVTGYETYSEYGETYTFIALDDNTGWVLDGIGFEQGDTVLLTVDNKGTADIADDELLIIEKAN